jgi:signal transduction histidine kinase
MRSAPSDKEDIQLPEKVETHLRDLAGRGGQHTIDQDVLHMLMVIAHDIRGPLVAMAATLKLLIRGSYGTMDDSVRNTVQDLFSRVVQLLGMAEDCLGKVHSVNDSIVIEREALDLRQDIIDPVLEELSSEIQSRKILIDNRLGAIPVGSITIHVNKMWLKAVFRNLFKNAIKYGGRGCRIAFGFQDLGHFFRLNVYNSGTPVPQEHREKLFTKFGRILSDDAKSKDGVGLGLYLIKEIIQKHGGDIWYEARLDGSDFIFTIPKDPITTSHNL